MRKRGMILVGGAAILAALVGAEDPVGALGGFPRTRGDRPYRTDIAEFEFPPHTRG